MIDVNKVCQNGALERCILLRGNLTKSGFEKSKLSWEVFTPHSASMPKSAMCFNGQMLW